MHPLPSKRCRYSWSKQAAPAATGRRWTRLRAAVTLAILAVWIYGVFHAERRPEPGNRSQPPDREVTGGIFRAHGGRQLFQHSADAEPAFEPAHRGWSVAPGQGKGRLAALSLARRQRCFRGLGADCPAVLSPGSASS